MPCQKDRKRCRRRRAYCVPFPRPCIDSLPRHHMPHCPVYRPCPPYHAVSNSSPSDYSGPEEDYCTVDNCRNAPMCINTQPPYCPYGFNDPCREAYAKPEVPQYYERDVRDANQPARPTSEVQQQRQPQMASTPLQQAAIPQSYPTAPTASSIHNPSCGQRPDTCPYSLNPQQANAPCPQVVVRSSTPEQQGGQRPEANFDPPQYRTSSRLNSFTGPDNRPRDPRAPNQFPSYYSPTHDSAPSQSYLGIREPLQETLHSDECLSRGPGYCSMKAKCNKELSFKNSTHYYTLPESSAGGNYGPRPPSAHDLRSNLTEGAVRRQPVPPSITQDPFYMQSAGQGRVKSKSRERSIPYIHDAVSTSIQTGNRPPSCLCRFPPAFKHFSCTGNINGKCCCDDRD